MNGRRSDRTSMQGYVWAARASQVAAVAVAPPLLGYALDRQFGTEPWLLVIGGVLGFGMMMLEVVRLSSTASGKNKRK